MKTYTIIGGVNGTGKSSLTGSLKATTTSLGTIIDPNKLGLEQGLTPVAAGRLAVKKIRACLERGVCFTQESTLSGHFVPQLAKQAREQGYYIRLYYVGLDSAEESVRRIANRVAKGGHNIAEDVVRRRFTDRWAAVAAVLPYCDEATFFDNENGFREVAEYRNGELVLKTTQLPDWLRQLQAYLETA
jgi:predicted ABC-type ATPase